MRTRWALLVVLLVLAQAPTAVADDRDESPRYVLALGDSLTFGFQRDKFVAGLPDPDPATFNTGWVDLLAARLAGEDDEDDDEGVQVVNLGCHDETTGSFLAGPCPYRALGFRLHVDYDGAQIDAAERFIETNRPGVKAAIVSLGANDALELLEACGSLGNIPCVMGGFPALVETVARNYAEILGRLSAAAPRIRIVVLLLYNPFALPALDPTGLSNQLTRTLNEAIATVAEANGARVADPFREFNRGRQPKTLCALTLMCTSGDIHPSDRGYKVLFQSIWKAGTRGLGDGEEDD
jgi:lysophospholipase L1-like esterase